MSNRQNIRECLAGAGLLIGAVPIEGARTPLLVTKDMLKLMKPRAVIVDLPIDQDGYLETSRPTTHSNPIYKVHEVIHYCVSNGAIATTNRLKPHDIL